MWRKNEIGAAQVEQWIPVFRRLDSEYVKASACNNAFFSA